MRYITLTFILSLIIAYGCQTSEPIATNENQGTETEEKAKLSHPDWYASEPGSYFAVDSTLFAGYAQSSNGDSLKSHQMAQKQARANLEAGLSNYFEDRRKDFLETNPSSKSVDENEFKFILRNISEKISREAEIVKAHVNKQENRHIGYCKTQISSQKVEEILSETFADQRKYLSIVQSWD